MQFTAEELDAEAVDVHYGGWLDDQLVAVISARPMTPLRVCLRQLAVDPPFQRQGYGQKLLLEVESRLLQRAVEEVELDARQTAINFYEKQGYHTIGEPFVKLTLPHRKMIKRLT